jgi:hypothetical protein
VKVGAFLNDTLVFTFIQAPPGAPTLVSDEDLRPLLRNMDCYRILNLTSSGQAATSTTATTEDGTQLPMEILGLDNGLRGSEELGFDAGEEEPYRSEDGELVLLMAVTVDGQLAVGADVLQQVPASAEDGSDWKLVTREELFL